MKIISAGQTDVGKKRSGNEDSFVCSDTLGLYVVADGMGGHAAGEVASGTAVEELQKFLRSTLGAFLESSSIASADIEKCEEIFSTAVQEANCRICEKSSEKPELQGMGTTLSGLLVCGDKACYVHVGDSRIYRLRDQQFEVLTEDHSWVQEQLRRNMITEEEARTHRWRNVITRALGHKLELEVDSGIIDLLPGDSYLICSDGLTGMVEDSELSALLKRNEKSPAQKASEMIDRANEAGGQDNITLILLHVQP